MLEGNLSFEKNSANVSIFLSSQWREAPNKCEHSEVQSITPCHGRWMAIMFAASYILHQRMRQQHSASGNPLSNLSMLNPIFLFPEGVLSEYIPRFVYLTP